MICHTLPNCPFSETQLYHLSDDGRRSLVMRGGDENNCERPGSEFAWLKTSCYFCSIGAKTAPSARPHPTVLLVLLLNSILVRLICRPGISGLLFSAIGVTPDSSSFDVRVSEASSASSVKVVPFRSTALICGPLRLNCRSLGFFCLNLCRNEYNVGAFATKVAARNSPVVHVMRLVSEDEF